MKKIVAVLVIMAVGFSGLYANGRGDLTTIEGKLTIHESLPAVETKNGLWLLPPGPFYRIAWENGVSTGDTLVVRGFTDTDGRFNEEGFAGHIMPVEVSVNGKDIAIERAGFFGRLGFGRGGYGRGGYGRGDCGSYGGWHYRDDGRGRFGDRDDDGFRDRGRNR